MSNLKTFIAALATLALAACSSGGGSGNGPAATINPATGSVINTGDAIAVLFDRSMDTTTLTLGGTMAGGSDGGTWSTTTEKNDTLTIAGVPGWDASAPGTLTIDAADLDGDAIRTVSLNYRILIQLTNFQPAGVVLGQADFTGTNANQGGVPDANTMAVPYSTLYANDILYVSEWGNDRITGFNGIPSANNATANFVLGQIDFNTAVPGTGAAQLETPEQLATDGIRLFIAEHDNQRVTIRNTLPTSGPGSADIVVGQADFGVNVNACTASGTSNIEGVATVDGKLIVTDTQNNRVLIWNSIPTTNGTPADLVLGQNSFTNCIANDDDQDGTSDATASGRTFQSPNGVWSDGSRLVVADYSNNRVLIWNSFPTSSFTPADIVLGQNDFTSNTANDDNQDDAEDATPSNRSLRSPYFVRSNGTQLVISEWDNNRVLVWNSLPTANFQPADVVLGQSDFVHSTANDDDQNNAQDAQATARTLNGPAGVLIASNKLIVADASNNRVLVFEGQ